ncbi:MAG: TMEM175 family protein [bacterium]
MNSTTTTKKRALKKIAPETESTYGVKNQRIDGLSDGIFAIVMTLLAFDLRIPGVYENLSDFQLLQILGHLIPVFLSYGLSFALLFTYWRSHHFLTSIYAKNLTVGLANYNAMFFLFIAIVPFTAKLLGEYSYNHIAIVLYGLNVVCIGLALLAMRRHIEKSPKIQTAILSIGDLRSAYIRIIVPIISAVFAIVLSNINTSFSIALFAFGILFNIVPASSNIIHHFVDKLSNADTIVE